MGIAPIDLPQVLLAPCFHLESDIFFPSHLFASTLASQLPRHLPGAPCGPQPRTQAGSIAPISQAPHLASGTRPAGTRGVWLGPHQNSPSQKGCLLTLVEGGGGLQRLSRHALNARPAASPPDMLWRGGKGGFSACMRLCKYPGESQAAMSPSSPCLPPRPNPHLPSPDRRGGQPELGQVVGAGEPRRL